MLQKSSEEPLARMYGYLAWSIILGARRFKVVQIKSLGSCMAPPQGLKLLQTWQKTCLGMGIQICSNKGLAPFGAQ